MARSSSKLAVSQVSLLRASCHPVRTWAPKQKNLQVAPGEDNEDFMCAAVQYSDLWSVKLLYFPLTTSYKSPVNPVSNPNPASSHQHLTISFTIHNHLRISVSCSVWNIFETVDSSCEIWGLHGSDWKLSSSGMWRHAVCKWLPTFRRNVLHLIFLILIIVIVTTATIIIIIIIIMFSGWRERRRISPSPCS
jgi:hypothetical protein